MKKNTVVIVGLGYVGLPLALTIAKYPKYRIIGFGINKKKVDLINKKINPLPDLKIDKKNFKRLSATTDPSIFKEAEFIVVCVPTPVTHDYKPDLKPLSQACQTIAPYLHKGQNVIIESTINPGVCEEMVLPILEKTGLKGGKDFELAHCPERINPGDVYWNVENIPRNVGALTPRGTRYIANFYRSFVKANIHEIGSIKEAEATKILENAFRDINIAFVNELAKSFDKLGIDIVNVIKGSSSKPFSFLAHYPGCGVGGHCIPVDPYYLIEAADKIGFDHKFLKIARQVNNSMPEYTVTLLKDALKKKGKKLKGAKIGVLGLAYKKNVGDIRESPSLKIIEILKKEKAVVHTFDPYVLRLSTETSLKLLLQKVSAIIIATDHKEFGKLTPSELKRRKISIVVDGKNLLNKKAFQKGTILYKGIGR